jgi:sulfur-oxidizing protein SoxX
VKTSVVGLFFVLGGALCTAAFAQKVHQGALVPYAVVGDAIPKPLTSQPGDAKRGRAIVENRQLGNCLACHSLPIPNAADPGNVGPPLAGIGSTLTAGELRLRVVDSKVVDPTTIMPSYYRVRGLHDVEKTFAGKPMLDAQQVEDVVAYLQTLK